MDGAIDIFYPSIAFNFGPMLTKLFSIDPTKYQDLLSTEKKNEVQGTVSILSFV